MGSTDAARDVRDRSLEQLRVLPAGSYLVTKEQIVALGDGVSPGVKSRAPAAPVPDGMTSEKLRAVAHWLDVYDGLVDSYIAMADLFGVSAIPAVVERARDVARSREVQVDLESWADQIEPAPQHLSGGPKDG